MATRVLLRSLISTSNQTLINRLYTTTTSSVLRIRPLVAAANNLRHCSLVATRIRAFSTRQTTSSLNDSNPNWSNRPPKETILLDGCDFEHWLVVVEKPEGEPTRDEIIDSYINTLAKVVGSYDEARMKIYSVSTRCYFAFGALVSEEDSYKIKELPGVRWVLPDSYLDVKNKDYGGEPFIDGKAVPYDPKYHEEWIRNNARANERNRRNDRPRTFDRSRNFERRRENMQSNRSPPGGAMGGPPSNMGGPPNAGGAPPSGHMGGPPNPGGAPPSSHMGGPPNVGGAPSGNMGGMQQGGGGQPNWGPRPSYNGGSPNMGGGGGMPPPNMGGGGMPPPNMSGGGGMPPPNMGGGGMPPPNMSGGGGMPPPNMGGGMAPPNMGGGGMPPPNMGGGGRMPPPPPPPHMGNGPNYQQQAAYGPNGGGMGYQSGPGPNGYGQNVGGGNSYQGYDMPGRDMPPTPPNYR